MTKEEIEEYKKLIKFETPRGKYGGQHVGVVRTDIRLICEEANFDITIGPTRSQHQNREIALMLFELYLTTLK